MVRGAARALLAAEKAVYGGASAVCLQGVSMEAVASESPFLLANAHERIGQQLGVSDWVFIDQTQVNVFGEVTRWRTPGHCEPEIAKHGPFGGTLLHGFHMVSLLSHFYRDAGLTPSDGDHVLNYGLDKMRVLKPVVIGDGVRLRSRMKLLDVTDKGDGERLLNVAHELECEGLHGPVLYAEYLSYWYPKRS